MKCWRLWNAQQQRAWPNAGTTKTACFAKDGKRHAETWPFAVEKAVFYTAICGILHYSMPPQTEYTSINNWLSSTYTKHDLCRFFMSEAGFLSSTGILRASNGQKMSEIFTNKEMLLSEKRKEKSEKWKIQLQHYFIATRHLTLTPSQLVGDNSSNYFNYLETK